MPKLIAIVGVTNCGKTTLMEQIDQVRSFGTIQVGKELRKRHPPEYFEGFAAMQKTEDEVWAIFAEEYQQACDKGAEYIFCDGQPRMVGQVHEIQAHYGEYSVIQLHAPREVLLARAALRHDSEEARELSLKRLTNDYIQLYDVLAEFFLLYPPQLSNHFNIVRADGEKYETYEAVLDVVDNLENRR